jgi:hypothetical protein
MKHTEVHPYTHFKNEKERRIFLILEPPRSETDDLVLMEVKFYPPGAERTFLKVNFATWQELVEEKKVVEFIPRIW